jgi:N-acetylglucosaminyl-diphospho-decaprenol L-rhamnosyltransferase
VNHLAQSLNPCAALNLSIVIVSWNARDLLKACLRAVFDTLDVPRTEVIVVDNGSDDGSVEMVRAHFPQVRLIENRQNLGFARANNQAIIGSRGRYVLLLNSDTEVKPGALSKMVRFLDTHPNVGIVGPRLLNTDGSFQGSCADFPTLWGEALLLLGDVSQRLRGPSYPYKPPSRLTRSVDWVSGACLMIRRDVIATVGLLDEAFFFYTEETDWCFRVKQAGWLVMHQPEAVVVHHGGGSSGRASLQKRRRLYASKRQLFTKHYGRVAGWLFGAAVWTTAVLKMSIWWLIAGFSAGQRRERARHNARSYATLLGLASGQGA